MCQLFALNSNTPTAATFSFTGFSARGGRTGDHVDGFGVAFHDDRGCKVFVDDQPACASPLAEFLRRQPMPARTVLAHVRRATQGAVQWSNCHPFVREWQGRSWSFCHNGDLQDFHPALDGSHLPVGSTDSERAFCWLLQQLRQRFGTEARTPWAALAPVLAELTAHLARHGRFNCLLSDGQAVFAHCSTRLFWVARQYPFATAQLVDEDMSLDLNLANRRGDRMVLVATEPLTRNEPWQAFASGECQVFSAGQVVWRQLPRTTVSTASPRPRRWALAA